MMLEIMVVQIHQQEGKVIEHINGGEFRIKFQSIEEGGLAIHHNDIL